MNLKKLITIYISSLFICAIACIYGSYYFLKDRSEENYIAYVEVKTSKSIDHIFLATSVDSLMTEYMTRSLNELIPKYDWDFNTANNISSKNVSKNLITFSRYEFAKKELAFKLFNFSQTLLILDIPVIKNHKNKPLIFGDKISQ